DTTTTDPRSRRDRAGRRGGQLLTRARGSPNGSACPRFVRPAPRSPDGRTIREDQPILAGRADAKSIMPVTNAIESLNAKLRRPGPGLPPSSTAGQGFVASWDASALAGCSRRLLAVASPCVTGGRRG